MLAMLSCVFYEPASTPGAASAMAFQSDDVSMCLSL